MKKKTKSVENDDFREPGFWEMVREAIFGVRRPLDCIRLRSLRAVRAAASIAPYHPEFKMGGA